MTRPFLRRSFVALLGLAAALPAAAGEGLPLPAAGAQPPSAAPLPGMTVAAPQAPAAAAAAPPDQSSYERWVPPEVLAENERRVLKVVRQWGHAHGATLSYDWRLAHAASQLLDWAQEHAGEPIPLVTLRDRAWTEGWTDGELAAVAVTTHRGDLLRALHDELNALHAAKVELDQVGVAVDVVVDEDDHALDRHTAVLAFAKRLIKLGPVPRQRPTQAQVVLTGRLLPRHVQGVELALTCPDGSTRRLPTPRQGNHFLVPFGTGATPGVLDVQLLLDRGRGPEVACAFPLQVGPQPQVAAPAMATTTATAAAAAPILAGSPAGAAPVQPHRALLSLLYGLRAAQGLPLPTPLPTLMHVAQSHAEDMARHHFFAHVSPRTGNVVQRLRAAHQPYLHVVENLAEGMGADQIFAAWLQSPSHRQNLLDPHVDAVGLAAVPGGPDAPWVAVLVMAALP